MSEPITNVEAAVRERGALPVPVGPQASELEHLRQERDAFRDQRNHVFKTNERLIDQVRESEQARLLAENEARRAQREAAALRSRVAELEAERHSTNEALDDAVRTLREKQERFETLRSLCDAAEHVGIVSGGWFTVEAVRRAAAGEPLPKPSLVLRENTAKTGGA